MEYCLKNWWEGKDDDLLCYSLTLRIPAIPLIPKKREVL